MFIISNYYEMCITFKKKQQKTKQTTMQGLVTKYQIDLWHIALTISGFKIFKKNSHCYIPLHSIVIKAKANKKPITIFY